MRTTINIDADVMKLIKMRQKKWAGASTNRVLMDLARQGAVQSMVLELLELAENISARFDELATSNVQNKIDGDMEQLHKTYASVLHTLCIARRFAHKNDEGLLKKADNDLKQLLLKGNNDGG